MDMGIVSVTSGETPDYETTFKMGKHVKITFL